MPAKNTPIRRIDQQNQQEDPRQASLLGAGSQSFSTQLTSVVEVPVNLTAGATYIVYSHLTPTAAQELSWQNADSRNPETYLVQWSRQSNFTNAVTVATPNPWITISGLPTGTTIYYRVAARIAGQQSEWSASISAMSATDTAPPAAVTNVQWQWSGKTGDLTITWTPPASPNYKDTRLVIRASTSGPVLREVYAVAGRYVWTRAQQAADTGGSYDSNVIVELTTRNTSNVFGSTVSVNPVLSAPSNPTGLSVSWNNGACTISWNIADVDYYRLTVDSVTRNIGYTNSYVYTLEQNAIDHGGTPTATLSISVRAVDALNQQSGVATINTTAPLPAQPSGLTTSWASDNGTAEADCVISWTRVQGVTYRLTIDSVARNVGQVDRFVYSFAQNQQEHSGNAAATLAISLVAVDPFNRLSSAATTTAINAAPPVLTAPSVQGFFSSCRFSWSPTTARDFLRYELDVRVNSTSVGVFSLTDTTYTFETTQSGSIDARVRVVDRFGQASAWSAFSSSVQLTNASQFVQELRQGVTYRDSVGSTQTALAALKDSNLTSGGITYTSSTTWRWIEANHNREIRHQTTTLATSTNVSVYVGVSLDGTNWTWYHGGSVSGGVWVPSSSTTSETTAQSGAATVNGTVKIRLSAPVQCQFIRLGMRNTSASYTIREFYPRSLVQSDDIAGETLSAISANLGTITAGSISSVSISASSITGGTITGTSVSGGTITGSTIQTATSGARVVLNSTGLYTYDSANQIVARVNTATNGAIQVGNSLTVDKDKLLFYIPSSTSQLTGLSFYNDYSATADMAVSSLFNTFSLIFRAQLGSFTSVATLSGGPFSGDATIYSTASASTSYLGVHCWPNDPYFLVTGSTDATTGYRVVFSNDGGFLDLQQFSLRTVSGSQFLSFFPSSSSVQLHATPTISSFANQYTAINFGGPAGQTRDIALCSTSTNPAAPSASFRFVLRLMGDAESGDAFGSNLQFIARNNDGSWRHVVFQVIRSSGHIGFGGIPSVSGGGVGSVDVYGDLRVRGTIRPKVDWTSFSLESNWIDASSITLVDPPVAYRVLPNGIVELRGIVRKTSGTSLLIGTLPTEARPSSWRRIAVGAWPVASGTPVGAVLAVLSNGQIHYTGQSLTDNNNYVALYCFYSIN